MDGAGTLRSLVASWPVTVPEESMDSTAMRAVTMSGYIMKLAPDQLMSRLSEPPTHADPSGAAAPPPADVLSNCRMRMAVGAAAIFSICRGADQLLHWPSAPKRSNAATRWLHPPTGSASCESLRRKRFAVGIFDAFGLGALRVAIQPGMRCVLPATPASCRWATKPMGWVGGGRASGSEMGSPVC
jgi:hypothetical protein